MFPVIVLLASLLADLPAKPLPPIKEPDWATWKNVSPNAKKDAEKAWSVLREHRSDREYATRAKRQAAERAVGDAYKTLDADKDASCASGVDALRGSKDDWERLMIATTVHHLGGDKGEPFLLWAMATAKSIDDSFEPVYEIATAYAAKHRPEYLPAVFSILRTHDGKIFLPIHSWTISTNECLFYVIGQYGRDVIPYLYPMLEHSDPYVRRNAAIVLGYFMDRQAKPALMKILNANDVGAAGAAFALGELGERDAAQPIARLLKNADPSVRFWAAYALYEISSKDSLAVLELAAKDEKDGAVLPEIVAAIERIRAAAKPIGDAKQKLNKEELRRALDDAEGANGLTADFEAIANSANHDDLERLEAIRRKSMTVPSDLGNKRFKNWCAIIKQIERRSN